MNVCDQVEKNLRQLSLHLNQKIAELYCRVDTLVPGGGLDCITCINGNPYIPSLKNIFVLGTDASGKIIANTNVYSKSEVNTLVNSKLSQVTSEDSSTIDFSGLGTVASPLTANVITGDIVAGIGITLTGDTTNRLVGLGNIVIDAAPVDLSSYYTKTEINSFFDGTVPILGYNKTEWDIAYADKINTIIFNTTDGILSFTQQDGGVINVNLDGRYLLDSDVDQIIEDYLSVNLVAGPGISISENLGVFTITNTDPDQIVSLVEGANITITGTYPNFTISGIDDLDAQTLTWIDATNTLSISNGNSVEITGFAEEFSTGNIIEGTGVNITGTLTNRLVGIGDITISAVPIDLSGYVPKSTTITINGVTQDLSTNRTWTVGLEEIGTPGTYTKVTTDEFGRVISGTNLVSSDLPIEAGAGISIIDNAGTAQIINTAPDQIVSLVSGANIVVTGTYPNFVISAIDLDSQTLSWVDSTNTLSISGGNSVEITGFESSFDKGSLIAGTGVMLSGTLTGRLVGSGDITISTTPIDLSAYYTKTEINSFFDGTTLINGYNKVNWDTAYDNSITGISFNTSTGVFTLTQQDSGTLTTDLDGRYLISTDLNNLIEQYLVDNLEAGTGIDITNTLGVFTVTNTLPDQVVTLNSGTNISVTGTYPNFTISSTDMDAQTLSWNNATDTLAISGGNSVVITGFEPSFTKGSLVAGTGVSLTGTLTNRLVGTGNVTINATPVDLSNYVTKPTTITINGVEQDLSTDRTWTIPEADGSETKLTAGSNISITGTGTITTPYVISTPCQSFGWTPTTKTLLSSCGTSVVLTGILMDTATISGGFGVDVTGDWDTGYTVSLNTTDTDGRYLRKDIDDNNGVNTLSLGSLLVNNSVEFLNLPAGDNQTDFYLTIDGTGEVRQVTSPSPNLDVANSAGAVQFGVDLLTENLKFSGTGDTTISFNPSTNTVTINSTPGSGGGGVVTSVDASITGALSVTGGPITSSGTFVFDWEGLTTQYVRGDGSLATFPTIPTNTVPNTRTLTINGTAGRTTVSPTGAQNLTANRVWIVDLAAIGTAGTYTKVTTDAYGRVTSGSNITFTDLPIEAGTGISITDNSGVATITNTAPDQIVSLIGAGSVSVTGTYPSFTITGTDTTYSGMTLVELNTGTSTTDRIISAKVLTDWLTGFGYIDVETDPIASAKTVTLNAGAGINVTGTTSQTVGANPEFTIINSAPDQTVILNEGVGVEITGAYPEFTINATNSSTGTVTSFSAGNLSPLFTTSVSNATTTPSLSFILPTTLTQYQVFGRSSAGTGSPSWVTLDNVAFTGSYNDLSDLPTIPSVTPSALSRVNDTNVTLTLGGTPGTALLQNVGITVGWQGTLSVARGGTGLASSGPVGSILQSNGTSWSLIDPPWTTNTGTVTSVVAGNGMSFTTITGAGSVTLGTPSSITASSINAVTTTSHTHELAASSVVTAKIANSNVTLAKIQNIPTQTLLGRYSAGTGVTQSITLDSSITLSSTGILSTTNNGTVTEVSSTVGGSALNVLVSTPTTTPSLAFTWGGTSAQYVNGVGNLVTFPSIPQGTVESVGLTMPSAFSVTGSPITSTGTFAVTGAGTISQYIRGNGTLATFPDIPQGTVTSVSAGNGMVFPTITETGAVTMGIPSPVTLSSINVVTANSHTHELIIGGTVDQFIDGTGNLQSITPFLGNIYNLNGTLTSNRILSGDEYNLTFTQLSQFLINNTDTVNIISNIDTNIDTQEFNVNNTRTTLTSAEALYISANGSTIDPIKYYAKLNTTLLKQDQTYQFPDQSGTIALLSDISGAAISLGDITPTTIDIDSNGLPVVTLPSATTTLAGLMRATDKTKLDGIATGANNYILPVATSTISGGVKLFSDTVQLAVSQAVTATISRTYGLQLNTSGQGVVNIPWTDTTYTASNGIILTGTNFTPNYGTTAGTIAQGNDSRILNGQTAFGWGNHALAGYELQSNKSTSTTLGTSNILYPTQNAVKTYVDNSIGSITTPNLQQVTNIGNTTTNAMVVTSTDDDVTINPAVVGIQTKTAAYSRNFLITHHDGAAVDQRVAYGAYGATAGLNYGFLSTQLTSSWVGADLKFIGGKVGINVGGTVSPAWNLQVNGDGRFSDLLNTEGGLAKTQNSTRVFDKVYQGYTGATSATGIISLYFPQATLNPTMFNVFIRVYGYGDNYLGELNLAFYKQNSTVVHAAGRSGILSSTDDFPTDVIKAGIDASGNVRINLGEETTLWGTYISFEVEKVETKFTGYSNPWNQGWTYEILATEPIDYASLVTLPIDRMATRDWVTSQIPTANNYVALDPMAANTFQPGNQFSGDMDAISSNSQVNYSTSTTSKPGFSTMGGVLTTTTYNNGSNLFSGQTAIGWGTNDEFGWRKRYNGAWGPWIQGASREWVGTQLGSYMTTNTDQLTLSGNKTTTGTWQFRFKNNDYYQDAEGNSRFYVGNTSQPANGFIFRFSAPTQQFQIRDASNVVKALINQNGVIQSTALAGGGTKMVTANNDGVFGATTMPTLSLTANPGGISISGGNEVQLLSLNRNVLQDFSTAPTTFGSGLYPILNTTTGTNYPNISGGGIYSSRNPGTSEGAFAIWKNLLNNGKLNFNVGTTGTDFNGWQTFASEEWVATQIPTAIDYVTTNTTQTGLSGDKVWTGQHVFGNGNIRLNSPSNNFTINKWQSGASYDDITDTTLPPSFPFRSLTYAFAASGNFPFSPGFNHVQTIVPWNNSTGNWQLIYPYSNSATAKIMYRNGSSTAWNTPYTIASEEWVTGLGLDQNIGNTNLTIPASTSRSLTMPGTSALSVTSSTAGVGAILQIAGNGANLQYTDGVGYGVIEVSNNAVGIQARSGLTFEGYAFLRTNSITTDRNFEFPDASGTLALTSDIPAPYTLPVATNSTLGGVELISNTVQSVAANAVTATASRTYGLQLNAAGQGVINVPWTNTTYTGSTSITLSGTSFQRAALTGDVTATVNSNATTIAPNAVTYTKFQQVPTQTLLGRGAAGTGSVGPVTVGAGLSLSSGGVLSSNVVSNTNIATTDLTTPGGITRFLTVGDGGLLEIGNDESTSYLTIGGGGGDPGVHLKGVSGVYIDNLGDVTGGTRMVTADTNGLLDSAELPVSGSYTPTVISSTNISGTPVFSNVTYIRVGDIVSFSGNVRFATSAVGSTILTISPPIATADSDATGVVSGFELEGWDNGIGGLVGNIRIVFNARATATNDRFFTGHYQIN